MACSKDCKKFGLAAVSAIVAINVLEGLFHEGLMGSTYRLPEYASIWNPETVMRSRMAWLLGGHSLFAVLLTKLYACGYEEPKPALGQGLRFGALMGLAVAAYHSLPQFAVYPVPLGMALSWAAGDVVILTLLGLLVSQIYHPHTHPVEGGG